MNDPTPGCDLLCISPHTDDLEIALGGTVALLADKGRRVWAADLTRGELGSNGSPDERWAEAAAASETLGLAGRVQFAFPDGFIDAANREQALAAAAVIRSLRPRWVVATPLPQRHPDHVAIPALVRKAAFLARLAALEASLPVERRVWDGGSDLPDPAGPWRCEAVFHVAAPGETPALRFDTSAVRERKTAALRCYASQFAYDERRRSTWINSPAFLRMIESIDAAWGLRCGVDSAEALASETAPLLDDLPAEPWR